PQASLQAGLVAHDGLLGLQQRLDTAAGGVVKPRSIGGQVWTARRALQQLHPELPLQIPDSAAQGWKRGSETGCRRGEAARLDDRDKHAGGIQIHAGLLSYLVGRLSNTPVYFHIWLAYLTEVRKGFRV